MKRIFYLLFSYHDFEQLLDIQKNQAIKRRDFQRRLVSWDWRIGIHAVNTYVHVMRLTFVMS